MHAILDAAYQTGTRVLCCTPHFHPGYFGDNYGKVNAAFERLSSYVQKTYPDMALYLGNELRYEPECVNWLRQGVCRTVNGTRYVLFGSSTRKSNCKWPSCIAQRRLYPDSCPCRTLSIPAWKNSYNPIVLARWRSDSSGYTILIPRVWLACSASMPEAVVPWADRPFFLRCTQLYVSPT